MYFNKRDKKYIKNMRNNLSKKKIRQLIEMQDNLNISNELRSTLQKIKNMDGGFFWSKTKNQKNDTNQQPIVSRQNEVFQQPIPNQQFTVSTPVTNQQQYIDYKNFQSIPLYNDGYSQALSESPEFQEGYKQGLEYIQKRSNQFVENPGQYEEYPGDEKYENEDRSINSYEQNPNINKSFSHVGNLMDNYLSQENTYRKSNENPDYEKSEENPDSKDLNYKNSEENPNNEKDNNSRENPDDSNLRENPTNEFPPKERYIPSFKKSRDPKIELNNYQNNLNQKRYMIKYLNTK